MGIVVVLKTQERRRRFLCRALDDGYSEPRTVVGEDELCFDDDADVDLESGGFGREMSSRGGGSSWSR